MATGLLMGLERATRNLPALVMDSQRRKEAGARNKRFAELVSSGDTEGAMNFALESGDPQLAGFANQYGRQRAGDEAAAAQAEQERLTGERSRFAQSLYNLAGTEDYEGINRAVSLYGQTPEGQADLQKQMFLEPHRKVQGMSTVRDRDGNVRLSPVIHNEQLGSQGPWTAGATADPGDPVVSMTMDQFRGGLQPYMEGAAGYEPKAPAEPVLRQVGDDLVLYDPDTKTTETIHQGADLGDNDALKAAKDAIYFSSPTSDLSEDLGEVGARRTSELALAGNVIRDLGLTSEAGGLEVGATIREYFDRNRDQLDAYRSGDPVARKRAAVLAENAVRERYGLETKKVPDLPKKDEMAEVEDGSWLDAINPF